MPQKTVQALRGQIIGLLIAAGHSQTNARELWESVYIQRIIEAQPGPHSFVIGKHTVTYTKPTVPSPVPLSDLLKGV